MSKGSESSIYKALGASSSKEGVLNAIGSKKPSYFIELMEDVGGDKEYYSFLHADGAGTKSIVAYLAFKETNDPSWFRSLAYDSLIMNLDDVLCTGPVEALSLSNTIGRNKLVIPDTAIKEVIEGYREVVSLLATYGITVNLCGGETADVGDLVRTIIIDSTLFGRVKRDRTISTDQIVPGDVIIGLSNTGQASYEKSPNSSLSSNGYTLARHALIAKKYPEKYPEILDPNIKLSDAYNGKLDLMAKPSELGGQSLVEALLSPTRTYAPILFEIFKTVSVNEIHGIINCTGGGQTKILRFGKGVSYIKDTLFPCPPIFKMIQESLNVPWDEMYSVFNMGHRIEIISPESNYDAIKKIAATFNVESRIIGRVEKAQGNKKFESGDANTLKITSDKGCFEYQG